MPRFFPSFGNRSRQTREQRPHDDYGQQHQQSPRVPTTAWSRVVPNGKSREHLNPDSSWDEDVFLERPDSYTGHGAYPNGTRVPVPGASSASSSSTAYLNQDDGHDNTHHRQRRPSRPAMMMPVRDRDDAAYLSDSTAAEEEYDNAGGRYAPDNTIPIVQRESSLTRLQEAFADHGLSAGSTRPVTELNLPQQQSTPIFQSAPVSLSGGPGPSSMAYSMSQSGMHDPYAHQIQSRSSPHHGVHPPVGQVYGNATAELRNVYPEQHLPILVPNMATANSQRGDVYAGSTPSSHLRRHHERQSQSQSRRAREKRPQTGYRAPDEYAYTKVGFGSEYDSEYGHGYEDDYERGAYEPEPGRSRRDRYRDYRGEYRGEQRPRVRRNSSASSRSLGDSDDQEYPPCVVVVERGRHGKKDTYYVIPGGAPVIFEDAKGNELTRVGDFTGRYRPRRQRPVIIEDSHGREIGRLGFDDESSLDYPYRHASSNSSGSDEDFYDRSRGAGYGRQRSYRDDGHVSSSRHSSKHPSREEGRYSPPRGRSPPSNSSANVVYIPYTSSSQSHNSTRAPSRHSGKSSRSGTGIREREYRDRDDVPYTYEPSTGSRSRSSHSHASRASSSQQVIHLDDHYTRQMSQSRSAASSRSSGRRSHDSERRL